jgi:hypothetical protein
MTAKAPRTFLDVIERVLLRIILGALAVLVLLLAFAWWHNHRTGAAGPGAAAPVAITPTTTTVTLVIDFGDGTQRRFTDLAFTPGMTAMDATRAATTHARPLALESRGQGSTAIITSIEGIRDETGADPATSRAWQFWVNGAYGETSAGAAALRAGDRVSWAYRAYGKDRTPPP